MMFTKLACLAVATAFAQNVAAQNDTVAVKTTYFSADNKKFNIVTQKNDTLALWVAPNDYESGFALSYLHFTEGDDAKTAIFVNAGKTVYAVPTTDETHVLTQRFGHTGTSLLIGRVAQGSITPTVP